MTVIYWKNIKFVIARARGCGSCKRIDTTAEGCCATFLREYPQQRERKQMRNRQNQRAATGEHHYHHPHTAPVVHNKISAGTMQTRLRPRK